jgi:hypothetical protein
MKTNNKPLAMNKKTYLVFHGQKQLGQIEAVDLSDAYTQAREKFKITLTVIARKEGM